MKSIFISQPAREILGVLSCEYDRGSYTVCIRRPCLDHWKKGRFYYVGDIVRPNVLYLKFTAADLVEFLFGYITTHICLADVDAVHENLDLSK
ncbi:hypothetical protein [Dipodfec virus UOA04_Rod_809]|nr:hypothetical protein [Dipodfec virus UOA04_Rod_809]